MYIGHTISDTSSGGTHSRTGVIRKGPYENNEGLKAYFKHRVEYYFIGYPRGKKRTTNYPNILPLAEVENLLRAIASRERYESSMTNKHDEDLVTMEWNPDTLFLQVDIYGGEDTYCIQAEPIEEPDGDYFSTLISI